MPLPVDATPSPAAAPADAPFWAEGRRTAANGCCSAIEPCSHQRASPNTLCDVCAAANGLSPADPAPAEARAEPVDLCHVVYAACEAEHGGCACKVQRVNLARPAGMFGAQPRGARCDERYAVALSVTRAFAPATAAGADLREAAQDVLKSIDDLIAESGGVYGLHRNGDDAPWSELTEGGSFGDWLKSIEVLRARIAAAPAAAPAGSELPGLRRALKILRHPNAGMEPPDGGSPSQTDRVRNVAEEIEELIAAQAAARPDPAQPAGVADPTFCPQSSPSDHLDYLAAFVDGSKYPAEVRADAEKTIAALRQVIAPAVGVGALMFGKPSERAAKLIGDLVSSVDDDVVSERDEPSTATVVDRQYLDDYVAGLEHTIAALRRDPGARVPEELTDAARYRWLRTRDVDQIHLGGVFAGRTPDNVVLTEEDLDRAVDAAMRLEASR